MSEALTLPQRLLFRPDAFFLKPWKGWGLMRDRRGRPMLRYEATGAGLAQSRGATAEQTFTFENGAVHTVEWEILSDDETHFYAVDRRTGVQARGEQVGQNFVWSFGARAQTPFGQHKVRTEALYAMVSPTAAFSFTKTSLWGLPLNTFTTFYEHR